MDTVCEIKAEYFNKSKYFCNARTTDKTKENNNITEILKIDMKTLLDLYQNGELPRIPAVDISKYSIEHIPQLIDLMISIEMINNNSTLNVQQRNDAINFLHKLYTKTDTIYFINPPYRIYILIDYTGKILVFRDEFYIINGLKCWSTPKLDTFPDRIFMYKISVDFNIVNNIIDELIIKQNIKTKFEIDYIFQTLYDNLNRCLDTELKMTKDVIKEYKEFILKILNFLPSSIMIYGSKLSMPKFKSLSECQ